MLRHLDIRDMLIIERLELAFRPGLNVLTGETGAGKSILLDALGFVLGWKGRAETVRQGAEDGAVTAVFDLPPGHAARLVLAEAGLPEGDELILRRVATPDGRKTAFVNDRRSSAETLRALGATLVELHGQGDDGGLSNPRGHRALLDAFAGAEAALTRTRAAWSRLQVARRGHADAEEALARARAEDEFLRHAVGELDKLAPRPGEEASLDTERRLMQAAGRIREDVARAAAALGGDGAEGRMADALRWLEKVADRAETRLDAPIAALGRALSELGEAADGVKRCLAALNVDPAALERVADRLYAIRALARKHNVAPDDLAGAAEDFRRRLEALDAGEAGMARLEAAVVAMQRDYAEAAQALAELRRGAARKFDSAVSAELAPLKLDRASFATEITAADPGAEGTDAVQFTVSTVPGAAPGPLNRIASGGEQARFLLALRVVLAKGAETPVLIFDEIDRGVGGATADAVGRRLVRLAQTAQVLVVTHSPQVAARGAHHWRVEKRLGANSAVTDVAALSAPDRVEEIARMLAGDTVTDAARKAARALLAG